MATVRIDRFGGIAPRTHPALLPDGMAVEALNCRLKTGKLVPLREPREYSGDALTLLEGGISNPGEARSMHAWRRAGGGFDFLCFPGVTWAAPGSAGAADPLTRLLVSGDRTGGGSPDEPVVYLRETDASGAVSVRPHALVKASLPAPRVRRDDEAELGETARWTRFCVTWVDALGYESPSSTPSLTATAFSSEDGWTIDATATDGTVTVSKDNASYTAPGSVVSAGGGQTQVATLYLDEDLRYNDGDRVTVLPFASADVPQEAEAIRLYKVVTGTSEGRWQLVAEWNVTRSASTVAGYSLAVPDEDAAETMPEIEAPPADLTCVRWVPGGFWCGFSPSSPRTVMFSDVGLPYSWPEAYRYDTRDRIVALAATSNTVFALTDGYPHVLSGTAPESMTVAKIAGPAACVSARSVLVYRNAVFFASNEGLCTVYNDADAGTVCRNLTDKVWTRDQWEAMSPASCLLGQRDGALMLFMRPASGPLSYTIDLNEDMMVAVSRNDEEPTCLCEDTAEDKLYFVRGG